MSKPKTNLVLTALRAMCLIVGVNLTLMAHATNPWESEIIYQIFPRSYRDGNGDRVGDLQGIEQGLPEIKKLGCTAILINPIVSSRVYHNYFADDFEAVDPEFGTVADFRDLIKAAHAIGIKVVLDMEPQYVADGHPWLAAVVKDPAAPEAASLVLGGSMFGSSPPWYDKKVVRIATVNMNTPAGKQLVIDAFVFWAKQGADGFRIDHMMDDLDNQHVLTDLYKRVWEPVEDAVHEVNPRAFFVGEQADWGSSDYVRRIFRETRTDALFAFNLAFAVRAWDRRQIEAALTENDALTPPSRTQLTFLENHDMNRFASVQSDPRLERAAAALLLTAKGLPTIYYGQELGQLGRQGNWRSDGNDIPVRLAYRWASTLADPRTATWYAGSGPWAEQGYEKDHDGISLAEEVNQPNSLYNVYRKLIAVRKRSKALSVGSQRVLNTGSPDILGFERWSSDEVVTVFINMTQMQTRLDLHLGKAEDLWTRKRFSDGDALSLPPYGFALLQHYGR